MIYFLIYLFIEIFITYEFTSIVSPFGTFLEIIATAVIGIFIIKNLNFSLVENMQKVLRREISQEEFISIGLFKLIGAILLIIPGVFSDILGILMQFEEFAIFITKKISNRFNNRYEYYQPKKDFDDDIIDVEIIEDKKWEISLNIRFLKMQVMQ